MNLLALIPGWAKLAILAALIAAVVGGYFAWASHQRGIGEAKANARWQAATDELKAKARATLDTETNKVRESESRLKQALATIESRDYENAQTIERLRTDLRAKSRAAGGPGLRDPFAPRCRTGGDSTQGAVASSPVDRAADDSEGGRLLSVELESFLLDQASVADQVNRAYAACRQDALNIRALNQ